jgi:hypothetical protein
VSPDAGTSPNAPPPKQTASAEEIAKLSPYYAEKRQLNGRISALQTHLQTTYAAGTAKVQAHTGSGVLLLVVGAVIASIPFGDASYEMTDLDVILTVLLGCGVLLAGWVLVKTGRTKRKELQRTIESMERRELLPLRKRLAALAAVEAQLSSDPHE